MGRWGDKIYESDSTLDFLAGVTDLLEREISYLTAPEQVDKSGRWLSLILPAIEMILVFERYEINSGVYLGEQQTAIQRWKEIVFNVWDGDWGAESVYRLLNENLDYRKQHRHLIVQMFDHLNDVALHWSDDNFLDNPFPLLSADHPLPFFSITRWKNSAGADCAAPADFVNKIMRHLKKEIIYNFSLERRETAGSYSYLEVIWAAIDLLGLLAEIYENDIGVDARFVRQWRETFIQIEKDAFDTEPYPDVIRAFDHLEAMVRKYSR